MAFGSTGSKIMNEKLLDVTLAIVIGLFFAFFFAYSI